MKRDKEVWASKIWVTWHQMGFGVRQYSAFHPDYVTPVGVVWVTASGGKMPSIDVHHSYVLPYFRRRGVRTAINEAIKKHCKIIHTWEGTKSGGEAFMKAAGYQFDPVRRDWYLLTGKEQRKPRRRKR